MNVFESDWVKSAANQVVSGVNSALAMSPGSQKQLKNLEGCTLNIHLNGLNSNFYFGVIKSDHQTTGSEGKSAIYSVALVDTTQVAHAKVSGSPIAFIKLLSQKNKAALFQSKELVLEGDAVRIQQILAFLSSLQIDWDGLLANFIGDVPAHFLGSSIRSGLLWGLNFSQSLMRDTEEFIKYELRLLPDNRRAQKQFSAISSLSNDLEALRLRFESLNAKVNK